MILLIIFDFPTPTSPNTTIFNINLFSFTFCNISLPSNGLSALAEVLSACFPKYAGRIRKYYESVAPTRETPYKTVDVRFDGQIICRNK